MKEVCVYRAAGYEEPAFYRAVEKIVEKFCAAHPVGADTKLLLKPNLVAKHTPEKAATTHPALVRAVTRAFRARGVRHITLADSCGGTYNGTVMRGVYAASGMKAVCEEEGVLLYEGFSEVQRKQPKGVRCREFTQLLPAAEADYIINLPKLKTHVMAGLSCAVKNLYGTIPGLLKAELHMRFPKPEDFGHMLVDLCELVKPALSIVDGVTAMEGDGPTGGEPRFVGIVAGGEDPYLTDLLCCRLTGIDPARVPYLAAARQRGLCPAHFPEEALAGEPEAAAPIPGFRMPESYQPFDLTGSFPPGLRWAAPFVIKRFAPHPAIQKSKCVGCGKCAAICPQKIILIKKKKAYIQPQRCIRCFCCHEMCPERAVEVRRFKLFNL